ncbi:response regulator [Pleurocapsales cyanobacterium LEGE 10410]|nr:response regulator [Pleurocapsales cyanobacterium LEGE 10410]
MCPSARGKSLRAGAKGYLLKSTSANELVQKIRSVYNDINLLESKIDNSSIKSLHSQLEELWKIYYSRFENIIEEYNKSIKDINDFRQIEQKLEQRLNEIEEKFNSNQTNKINELEYKNQSSWESIRQELTNLNTQFNQANRNLSTQFERQLSNIKRDLDNKLSEALEDWSRQRTALQEWAVQRDEMRPSLTEYESKSRLELMSVINQIRSSFRDVARQQRTTRNWLIASGLFTLLALAISGYLLVSQANSDSSLVTPQENPATRHFDSNKIK